MPTEELAAETSAPPVPPAPPSPPEPEIVARLYLPMVKTGKSVSIYGMSGQKYSFRLSAEFRGRPVREYTSLDQFEREELDLRKNTRIPHAICTLIGSVDPVQRATDAVSALISANLRVPGPQRLSALEAIQSLVTKAIEELSGQGIKTEPAPASTAEAMSPIGPMGPISPIPQPRPPLHPQNYTQPELQEMEWDALRALGATLKAGGGSRAERVAAILSLQN